MTPQERYLRDPVFHRLVNILLDQLHLANMTGTEIREAAVLAAQMYEMAAPKPVFTSADWIPEETIKQLKAKAARRCRGCFDPEYTHARDCPEFVPFGASS